MSRAGHGLVQPLKRLKPGPDWTVDVRIGLDKFQNRNRQGPDQGHTGRSCRIFGPKILTYTIMKISIFRFLKELSLPFSTTRLQRQVLRLARLIFSAWFLKVYTGLILIFYVLQQLIRRGIEETQELAFRGIDLGDLGVKP